jgi:phytoene desaturase
MATAIRLRLKGYQVTVFEANAYPGGKLTTFTQGAYRFDAGPSLFTMPNYVDELFLLAGKDPASGFPYIRKDETCRYFWPDGSRLVASSDPAKFASHAGRLFGIAPEKILSKFDNSKLMYEKAGRIFLENPLHRLSTWFSREVAEALPLLHKFGLFSTMHKENLRLLKHPGLVQLFDRFATYNGSDPYRAPALLNIIPHFEHSLGVYHPVRGMHQITESLHALASEIGVRFHFEEKATEIVVLNNRAVGIRTAKDFYPGDLVVSNMDVVPTYRQLLPGQPAPERTLRQERSSSALVFYWGIKKTFPQLGLHNIFFSRDYKTEFADIFRGVVPAKDPTIYVNITSKDVLGDAPPGCENWFVMVNVPQHQGQDWQALIPQYRQAIADKLNPILDTDLTPTIENESTLTPDQIESKTSSLGGSLYGTSSNSRFAAFLRHANESSRIGRLYFCGGSVHPGGGIPLCLLSAKIVSELCPNPSKI